MKPSRWRTIFKSGQRYTRFSRPLSSDLPGVTFQATIQAVWNHGDAQVPGYVKKSQVHDRLTVVAQKITREYSVLQQAQAQDALNVALTAALHDQTGLTTDMTAVRARLRISHEVRELAAQREQAARRRQLELDNQSDRARLLHEEILNNPLLARAWWMTQDPNLITAVGNKFFEGTVDLAEERAASTGDPHRDELLRILVGFADWLNSNDRRVEQVLDTFGVLLNPFPPGDLHTEFHNWRNPPRDTNDNIHNSDEGENTTRD